MASEPKQVAKYNDLHKMVNFFRALSKTIEGNYDVLLSEGVFRLSGNLINVNLLKENIFKQINEGQSTDSLMEALKGQDINDLVSLAKSVHDEFILLDLSKYSNKAYLDVFNSEQKDLNGPYINLIDSLLDSEKVEHQCIGEILYRYLHLLDLAKTYSHKNRMNVKNLAITYAPLFINALNLDYDLVTPAEQIIQNTLIQTYLEISLTDKVFEWPFEDKYEAKLPHLQKSRQDKSKFFERFNSQEPEKRELNGKLHAYMQLLEMQVLKYETKVAVLELEGKKEKKTIKELTNIIKTQQSQIKDLGYTIKRNEQVLESLEDVKTDQIASSSSFGYFQQQRGDKAGGINEQPDVASISPTP
jgi:RhoGAP domain